MAMEVDPKVPEFISFLFSCKPKFDVYFVVGNEDEGGTERIGAVKLMLMAHSEVFRVELEYNGMAEKHGVTVKDISIKTFKTLLKYIYGHDTTAELCFDDADNMLYVAEKYMMTRLKNKLAIRLMDLLSPDNICSLINNPVCYTHLELNSAIIQILQFETQQVLASPQFVGVSPEAFVKILEQDGLKAEEIDLWRAAVKWAKYRADSDSGKDLRKEISKVSKHLRICTLNPVQFCQEVAPTKILNTDEVSSVCLSISRQEKQNDLTTFCNEIIPRRKLQKKRSFPGMDCIVIPLTHHRLRTWNNSGPCVFTIITKESRIELLPLKCEALANFKSRNGATCLVECSILIVRVSDLFNDKFSDDEKLLKFRQHVKFGESFNLPLSTDGSSNLILDQNSRYVIGIDFLNDQITYDDQFREIVSYENEHLCLCVTGVSFDTIYYHFPSHHLLYRVVETE